MELEKEVRYSVTDEQISCILKNTTPNKSRTEMLDITCGYSGFNSYNEYNFICRIRQKDGKKTLEVKNYFNENECLEQSITLEKITDGINFLKLIGMSPYLYLKRFREVRTFKSLKIFIDEFDLIGKYVEIEYQDSSNVEEEIKEFMLLNKIEGTPQDMYGDIVKERLENDLEFKKTFDDNLEKILNEK